MINFFLHVLLTKYKQFQKMCSVKTSLMGSGEKEHCSHIFCMLCKVTKRDGSWGLEILPPVLLFK